MPKLARFLKPFIPGLLLAVVLLFGQAICDLNLPNLMSNIVNVGIQQQGLQEAAPAAISQKGLELITAFSGEGEKQLLLASYALVAADEQNVPGEKYNSQDPLAEAQFYLKKELDPETAANLDHAFGIAVLTLTGLQQEIGAPAAAPANQTAAAPSLTQLYQLLPRLKALPAATVDRAREKALASDPNLSKQSGIMFARLFYAELGFDLSRQQTGYIVRTGLLMLLIALLAGCASILVSFISAKIATGTARNLRRAVFAKVESFSNKEFDKFSSSSLITRCTNDITQIQELLLLSIRLIFYAPLIGIGAFIMAISKSPSMSWIIALALFCLLSVILVLMSIVTPKFKIIQKLIDRLNLVSRENLSGLTVIRAFSAQSHEKARFDLVNRELTNTILFVSRVMIFMMPGLILIMNGVTLLVIWVGARQIASSSLQIGDMIAFMQYAIQIVMAFLMFSMMFILAPRAAVSAQRIGEVLETTNSILDPPAPKPFNPGKKGQLEFQNVHFRYQGAEKDALYDISFTAKPGQTTALIGSTGSGKSTVASLALRFYDVSQGRVLVDGVDIREVRQGDLRAKIGFVPQKGILLSGSVAFNLEYGDREVSRADLEEAARIAQIMDFISETPEGFNAEIAQGGANISGGQKQRLSIARALAKKPEILIFDDSFSALDFKTDAALRQALKKHTARATVILVAQRVSTIMQADQIIVLNEGRVAGQGTHRELLKNCPAYFEIASSQLSKEELA